MQSGAIGTGNKYWVSVGNSLSVNQSPTLDKIEKETLYKSKDP